MGIIFAFNIYLGLYCLLLLIINILLGIFVNRQFTDVNKAQTQPRRIQNYFKELLSSKKYVKETKTYRLERYFYEKVKEMYLKMRDAYYKVYRLNEITNQGVFFANFLFRIGLIVILIYTVYLGQLNVGEAALIQIAGTSLINVSWQFKQPVGNFVRYLGAAPTMIEMLYPVSKEERKEMKKVDYDDFSLQLGEFQKIEIHNASYKYPSREEDVVKNINLTINKGDIISILGYNGSGKTTTAKLISGVLNPTSGSILFNGENVSNIDIKEYYKYFGIGFQDFAKYSLTLRENIGFGRINDLDNDEYIDESIKKANLKPILKKMPEGLNTVLGKEFAKKGQDLSGGEWQKIILSRAYMGSPEILILDEPTASIDPFEEERMLEEFDQILKGKTAILISHRISFARLADKIVMMKNREIVETGNHTELLKLKGYYHELFMSQQNLYIDGGDIDE